ncbi:MAG TPA: class I SAM-dependent methyltransferase [Thermoanaerobaculia bacterium]|nr:class I SAM-dependent methyltransferase [Thermoanaerobaculia bacterium]
MEQRPQTSLQAATSFWDTPGGIQEQRANQCWLTKPYVRQYVIETIGSGRLLWPVEWLKSLYPTRFGRGLSIGCGSGALERSLMTLDVCERVDAFDGAVGSLDDARQQAAAHGWSERLRYFAADFNTIALPRDTYDIVFFNQSLHHVARLEYLLREVHRALKPDGLLYADEYVGPSRHQWTPDRLTIHQIIYGFLPPEWRYYDRVPAPIEYDDPSEAIRSSEILPQMSVGFDIVQRRDYGGTLLSILIPIINWSVAPEEFQRNLIIAEREWLLAGGESYMTVVVARPKRGIAGMLANVRYLSRSRP